MCFFSKKKNDESGGCVDSSSFPQKTLTQTNHVLFMSWELAAGVDSVVAKHLLNDRMGCSKS
jgi:hypothetical protein